MKRYTILLVLSFCALLSFSQNVNKGSLCVHLNDGQTNTFPYAEIDSMTVSHFDTDSVYQDEMVTQEIWTAEKTHRFPLASIDSVTFVYLPDISGTWNCTETHYRANGDAYCNTYTITLCEDGTVQTTATDTEIISSSWSLSADGDVSISIIDVSTQTANSGMGWGGTVDSMESPMKITGQTHRWNYNTVGYFSGDYYDFEMTR